MCTALPHPALPADLITVGSGRVGSGQEAFEISRVGSGQKVVLYNRTIRVGPL